eukprot:Skav206102  [mRNA]  locus=scaffold6356:351:575:- [translate_table: standard]
MRQGPCTPCQGPSGFTISSHLLMCSHALSRHVLAWATKITRLCRRAVTGLAKEDTRSLKSVQITVSATSGWDFS